MNQLQERVEALEKAQGKVSKERVTPPIVKAGDRFIRREGTTAGEGYLVIHVLGANFLTLINCNTGLTYGERLTLDYYEHISLDMFTKDWEQFEQVEG